jgi:small subunit ribosomal protein S19e
LLARLTEYIKGNIKEVAPPDWAMYAKTGVHVERAPQNPDWWYVRCAALYRKIYVEEPVGVSRLRKMYGGRKRRGVKPAHFRRAGGSIIRHALQQLESEGLVSKKEKGGRILTPRGRSLLDAIASQIKKDLERENPGLKKY